MGEVGTKFILLARKVSTLVATFPHKTSITTGSGIALGCELTSVRGDRGENYVNTKKHMKKKKNFKSFPVSSDRWWTGQSVYL